jgi:4-hydroxy-tetrahydrodipicolinate synthase
MPKNPIEGVVALVPKYLPSNEDGELDEESFRNLLDWMIEKGANAIGVLAGVDFHYNDAERKKIAKILVDEVNGRVPCFMGASAFDTETAIKRAKELQDIGVDAIFVTGPPLDHPLGSDPQNDIVEHFRKISDAVDIPIGIYNTPNAWPGIMPPETLRKIEQVADMVTFIKAGQRDLESYMVMVKGLAQSRLKIITGKSYYQFHMLNAAWNMPNRPVGLTGYIAGILPAEHAQLWKEFQNNNIDKARLIWQSKILPLADLMYGTQFGWSEDIMPLEVLRQMGIIKYSRTPYSVKGVSDYLKKEIAKYLEQVLNIKPII